MNSIFPHEKIMTTGNLSFERDIKFTVDKYMGGSLLSIFKK